MRHYSEIVVAEAFRHLPATYPCDWPSDEELDLYARATEAGLSWETAPTKVIQLAERAQDVIAITELEPMPHTARSSFTSPSRSALALVYTASFDVGWLRM